MPINYQDGKIYTIVNTQNDIVYVGSTAQKRLSSRMAGHRIDAKKRPSMFYIAMREIGDENFAIHLHHVFPCDSKDELEAEENRTIDLIIAEGKEVYNSMRHGKHSEESKAKMSALCTGRTYTEERNKNVSAALTGRKLSDEHKKNIGAAQCTFGGIFRDVGKCPRWIFQTKVAGKIHKKTFAISKYGEDGARSRAEEARQEFYPEWVKE